MGKAQAQGQIPGLLHQLIPGLNTINVRSIIQGFKKKIVEDKTKIGLPCPMINELNILMSFPDLLQERLNKLGKMVDLFQLSPAVLIHLAVSGKNMQLFQQFDGLTGFYLMHDKKTVVSGEW